MKLRVAVAAVFWGVVALPLQGAFVQGSSPFATATVKSNTSGDPWMALGCHGTDTDKAKGIAQFGPSAKPPKVATPPVGSCAAINVPLKVLIAYAFDLKVTPDHANDRVLFGPAWAPTARFDVEAKAVPATTEAELRRMLQTLLIERFKLQLRHETDEQAGYTLRVGPRGAKLNPPTNDAGGGKFNGAMRAVSNSREQALAMHWAPVSAFADFLATRLGKPVIDETHITGSYDINLRLPSIPNGGNSPEALLGAVQQQLGFELDAQTILRDTIIIDDAQRPGTMTNAATAKPPAAVRPIVRLNAARSTTTNATAEPAAKSLSCRLNIGDLTPGEAVESPVEAMARNAGHPEDLQNVLARASQYVAQYENQLGNIVGEEVYLQNASWKTAAVQNRQSQRRTEADFAILKVGPSWVGVREVTCVDGENVKKNADDFQGVLGSASQQDLLKKLEQLSTESANFNIGDVQRNTNLPTFTLRVLHPLNIARFDFSKSGEATVAGTPTWAIHFQETHRPTIIHDVDGTDEFASGTLWIEPQSGRIVRTELSIARTSGKMPFRARTDVDFDYNSKLEMWLPAVMQEHYETDSGHMIDCRADYLNFRRFQVQAKFNFGPPPFRLKFHER